MPYIPKIKIGNTTYDLKDTEAREIIDTVKNKWAELSASSVTVIPANSNINDSTYLKPGTYIINSQSAAGTISNLPIAHSGRLIVLYNYSSSLPMQIYIDSTRENIYYRKINPNSSPAEYGSWHRIMPEDEVSSAINSAVNTIKTSWAELAVSSVTVIPADSDINDSAYLIPGTYIINSQSAAGTISNLPIAHSGRLIVLYNYSSSLPMQIYIDSTRENIYYRKINPNSSPAVYGDWHRIMPEDEVEAAINAGRTLKVLCIGNSGTNDATAYTPFIVENISDLRLTLGTSYVGGASIAKNLELFDSDEATVIYYKKTPGSDAWTWSSSRTLKQIIASEDWDIITFQQASGGAGNWSTFSMLNELIDKVAAYHYSCHSKTAKIGWLMPQITLSQIGVASYAPTYEAAWAAINQCIQNVLLTTPVQFVIPCGTSVENARTTSLDSLGESGHLTHDNAHLQRGLPSLIPAYVAAMKFLELAGESHRGILYENTRPTTEWTTAHHTPGENGTESVGVTEANCLLAQKCAIAAMKKPYEITDCSVFEGS